MSKKNRGGFTPRTEPTTLPSEPRVFAEAPAVVEPAVEATVAVEEVGAKEVAVVEGPAPSLEDLTKWMDSRSVKLEDFGDQELILAARSLRATPEQVEALVQEMGKALAETISLEATAKPPAGYTSLPVPLDAPDPEVVDQVLEGVASTDPHIFQEPEQVTSVEVPHAHPHVEEVSPKADTLPPEAPDTDEEHPLPEGVTQASIEETRKWYEEYVAANPGHHIIDVLHPRLKELVPHLVEEVDVAEVLAFRGVAQALLKREKAKGSPCTSEGIIQFESTSFALWLVDPSVPVPSDAKIYVHKWYDVVTFLWGNRIILSATEQELQAYRG